jgi:WXG100 family type VII secretion target
MANQVQADYERLQQIAQRFIKQAEQTQHVTQRVKDEMGRLQQSWEGKGADAFFREMNQVFLPAIVRLQKAFAQTAQTVTRIATTMQDAETEAANLFKGTSSTSGGSTFTGYGGGYGDAGGTTSNLLNNDYPAYDEGGEEPQSSSELSEAQIAALAELGITVEDLAGATPEEIQNVIDFLNDTRTGNDDTFGRISTPILDTGIYTGAELVEAVAILEQLSAAGMEFGQSNFYPTTWSLDELRQAGNTLETMADGATEAYIAEYGIEGLTNLASYYGLPPHLAHYGPLMSLLHLESGETFEIRRDSGNNVSYIDSVNGHDSAPRATYRTRTDTNNDGVINDQDNWGSWIDYHPQDATHTADANTQVVNPVVWYARYDGNAITFGNMALDGTNAEKFTDESLFAHELSHRMATYTDYSNFSTSAGDNEHAEGTYDNEGYENVPRTSEQWYEQTPDLLANGLLGTFTQDEAGEERQEDYESVITGIFEANDPLVENPQTPSDEYSQEVQTAMESQGLWGPPRLTPSGSQHMVN